MVFMHQKVELAWGGGIGKKIRGRRGVFFKNGVFPPTPAQTNWTYGQGKKRKAN